MAHAQKPDFVFRRNGRVHLNRHGRQFSQQLAAEVCASSFIVGSNVGYTTFRGGVKGTGYPLHSPVSPSLPLPCVTVCHQVSIELYLSVGHGASSASGARSPLTDMKGRCPYTAQAFAESRCGCCCGFGSGEGLTTPHREHLMIWEVFQKPRTWTYHLERSQ